MGQILSFIKPSYRILRYGLFLFFCLAIIAGCVSGGKPGFQVETYLINYPAPAAAQLTKIEDTIRINRFTIATAYNNHQMIFRQDDYALDSFNYNRWAVNPADMVGDNLLRDLQESGVFRAAFSRYAVDEGRYVLQGGIEEFFLRIDKINKSGSVAVVSLEITLKDTQQREATKRIIFQKKYRQEEALTEQSPRGYCQAMSLAVQKLSRQIIADTYQAINTATVKK
jgi:ABC-type uncharacterized transport system auxiliary subunit